MKKLLGLLFTMLVLVGCVDDKDPVPNDLPPLFTGSPIYYELFEQYYPVDNIESFNKESISGFVGADTTWVCGVKNGKRWMGMYDESSRTLLKEWNGKDMVLNPQMKIRYSSLIMNKIGSNIVFTYEGIASSMLSNVLLCLTDNLEAKDIYYPEQYKLYSDFIIQNETDFLVGYKYGVFFCRGLLNLKGEVLVSSIMHEYLEGQDNIFLAGFRDDKVWFALSDKNYLIFQEWNGVDKFERNIKRHLGYDKYEEYRVEFINASIEWLKTPWGYAFIPQYSTVSNDSKYSDVFLLNDGKAYYYPKASPSEIRNWYNGSILVDGETVISPEGKLIATLKHRVRTEDEPVSYTTSIGFNNRKFSFVDHEVDKTIWTATVDRLNTTQSDAMITMTLLEKKEQTWKYRCDIVNRDGSKQQFSLLIDVLTGKLTYL